MVKINQSKNKITVGKQVIELSIDEMNELYNKLGEVLGKSNPIPITYPPYRPSPINNILNPEKPWIDEKIPNRFSQKTGPILY